PRGLGLLAELDARQLREALVAHVGVVGVVVVVEVAVVAGGGPLLEPLAEQVARLAETLDDLPVLLQRPDVQERAEAALAQVPGRVLLRYPDLAVLRLAGLDLRRPQGQRFRLGGISDEFLEARLLAQTFKIAILLDVSGVVEAALDGTGKTVERLLLLALPGEGAGEVVMRVGVLRRHADRLAALLLCRVNILLLEQSVDLDLQPGVDGLHLRLTEHAGRRRLLGGYRLAHQQQTTESHL